MFILWKFKKLMQKSIFPQKIQKSLCITTKSLYTNSKFQTQLSQKLQRFRTCRKNKKCSIFHDLSEYIIFSYDCNLLDWPFNNIVWSILPNKIFEKFEEKFFTLFKKVTHFRDSSFGSTQYTCRSLIILFLFL